MISFLNPYAFLLLILVPIVVFHYVRTRTGGLSLYYSATHNIASYFKSSIFVAKDFPFILKILALVFLIIAFARPASVIKKSIDIGKGYYISLVLDVSPSMLGEDLTPTRLEAAKKTIIDFINSRQMDKISFVTFSTKAQVKSPTTLDYKNLTKIIDNTTFDADGATAIGIGLATAIDTLRTMPENSTKIIVLLTDGDNNYGEIDPHVASLIAASFGIKIYTIGIGDPQNNNVWVTWEGRRHLMEYSLNEQLLIDIARNTSSRYFNAKNTRMLEDIYETIDRLEKNNIIDDRMFEHREHYRIFLYAAIFLILLMFVLSNTKYITIP